MRKFKVWGTTQVHVVKIVEAKTAREAIEKLDASVDVTEVAGLEVVTPCSHVGLVGMEISDEWEPCDPNDAIELRSKRRRPSGGVS